MLNLRVEFGPCDPLNPGFGYQLRIEGPDGLVFFGNKHPDTGEDLTYGSCLDVVATHHARWVAQCLTTALYRHQLAALQRFATAHGRYWKRDLRHAWERSEYGNNPDAVILQGLRNTLGPSWLVKFRLPASEVQS